MIQLGRIVKAMIITHIFDLWELLSTKGQVVVPMHLLLCIGALAVLFRYPYARSSLVYALPIFVSMLVPPASSRWALRAASPMLDYFDFESVHMTEEDDDENDDERERRVKLANCVEQKRRE